MRTLRSLRDEREREMGREREIETEMALGRQGGWVSPWIAEWRAERGLIVRDKRETIVRRKLK